jgi:uncharacterized protein involved in response to NO
MKLNVLASGFRPFFLLTGLSALLLVPAWALGLLAGMPLATGWPPTLWHAHEMLFGFICSAIAGFLLTAVPSWTGQKGHAGAPLAALATLWMLARLLIASSSWWPQAIVAAVDLSFLPLLVALVAVPLVRNRNRNTPLLAVLVLFWLADLAFHIALMRENPALARHTLLMGIDLVLVLVTVIGGRIVPAFTNSALGQAGAPGKATSRRALAVLAISGMLLVSVGDAFWPDQPIGGWFAALAAVAQSLRLAQWQSLRTLRMPIVWVLHLAYAWLPVGLALKAAALLGGYMVGAFWLHALTIGALATMILAVMSRASLGHTGRALLVHPFTTLAYLLLCGAALVRVFGLAAFGLAYPQVIALGALLWTLSFALYLLVYVPILWGPRVDGRPG